MEMKLSPEELAEFVHSINNKMGGVVGYIDLLKDCELDARAKRYVDKLGEASSLLISIMTSLRSAMVDNKTMLYHRERCCNCPAKTKDD